MSVGLAGKAILGGIRNECETVLDNESIKCVFVLLLSQLTQSLQEAFCGGG